MDSKLTRRSFVAGTAAAGAVCATVAPIVAQAQDGAAQVATADTKWSFEVAPDPIAEDQIAETKSADVVVVGCGMSGMVTAVSAAEGGLSVIVVSASEAAVSRGGSNNAVYSKVMEEMGLPKVDANWYRTQYMVNNGNFKPGFWYKHYNNSEEAMNWLIDKATAAGLKVTVESGAEYAPDDIMYTPAGAHSFYADDSELDGTVGTGEPHIANELARLLTEDLGVEIDFQTKALQLVRGDDNTTGRVTAVIAQDKDGSYIKYEGSKAIVMATGDFTHNRDMMARFAPEVMGLCNFDSEVNYDAGLMTNGIYDGEGQQMELWVGAAWQQTPNAIMLGRPNLPADNPYTSHTGLMVDKNGQRFMNEDVLGGVACATIMHLPENTCYCIWGSNRAVEGGPWGKPNYVHGEYFADEAEFIATWDNDSYGYGIVKADTVEELVAQLGLSEATVETVNHYNELCAAGQDTDFYKSPEKLIGITDGPFYGCSYKPMLLVVLGGTRTNIDLQALDANDEPIPGLFNVGTMIGDFYSGVYTFAMEGMNYGAACITLPYLLGRDLAAGKFDE